MWGAEPSAGGLGGPAGGALRGWLREARGGPELLARSSPAGPPPGPRRSLPRLCKQPCPSADRARVRPLRAEGRGRGSALLAQSGPCGRPGTGRLLGRAFDASGALGLERRRAAGGVRPGVFAGA